MAWHITHTKAMKEVLGPGSKILVAQDFRDTIQEQSESVSVSRRCECVGSIPRDFLFPERKYGTCIQCYSKGKLVATEL